MTLPTDDDDSLAKRLGVQADVLREARKMFEERVRIQRMPEGQRHGQMMKLYVDPRHNIFLEPPEEMYQAWAAIRDARKTNDAQLLRGVVHAVLQLRTQPGWLTTKTRTGWVWKGQWLPGNKKKTSEARLFTSLNTPAHAALTERARLTNVLPTAIVRWGVCLFLHGTLDAQVVTTRAALYKRKESYCMSPRVT